MDISPTGLFKLLLPRIPFLLATALLNTFSLSANSSKQDATTELTVSLLRSVVSAKSSIGHLQHISLKDPGIKGRMWISQVVLPAPEDGQGLRDAIVQAIKHLGDRNETFALPEVARLEAEWTGHRKDVAKNAPQLDVSEEEKYKHMMAEAESPVTILYFHGGAYLAMSPASHRKSTSHLAKLTKGCCLSVAYRLAPQSPFPAQILDALIAYLYLLSPPPGSLHEAVPAGNIVFAGDSAGGNLAMGLMQTLLTLQRLEIATLPYHGRDVPLQLPAGLAVNSPWCDISRSLPSNITNARYDYLNAPIAPGQPDELLPDEHWPTQPPRVQPFCEASMLTHPLASPLAATPDLWRGCPPVFICCGNETLEDEITVTARRMYQGGASVVLRGYEGMPHCFAMIFPTSPAGKECLDSWAQFCVDAVDTSVDRTSSARWTKAFSKAQRFDYVLFDDTSKVSEDDAERLMREAKQATQKTEAEMLRKWNEGKLAGGDVERLIQKTKQTTEGYGKKFTQDRDEATSKPHL